MKKKEIVELILFGALVAGLTVGLLVLWNVRMDMLGLMSEIA